MRRSPIVIGATIAGTAGVLAFHPHSAAVPSAAATNKTATTAAAASTATKTTSSSSSSSSSTAKAVSGTATGNAIATQYGNAQVRVTVTNGKVVKIEALQLQGNDPRSLQISSSAEPILQQEALAKQTADVDAVSGATFTSASYTQSLQSALDKLGFKTATRASLQVPAGGGH